MTMAIHHGFIKPLDVMNVPDFQQRNTQREVVPMCNRTLILYLSSS